VTVRADIRELLHAGYGDRTIARQLGVTPRTVTRARSILGLPKARGGVKAAATVEDLFWRRVQPIDGGHLQWTGSFTSKGTPQLKWGGRDGTVHTAYRVAFRIRHGHDPVGYVRRTCHITGCVAPDHVADTAASASREEIVSQLNEGHSDREIGRALHSNPKQVARVRKELGIPIIAPAIPTLEQKWADRTRIVAGGHVRWTGSLRGGMPNLVYKQRNHSARRVAFAIGHGRQPVGRVLPGCGNSWCIAPEHATDEPMRRADAAYTVIFGSAAA
jgi:DNA-binding CsgD family transcriptional regulator